MADPGIEDAEAELFSFLPGHFRRDARKEPCELLAAEARDQTAGRRGALREQTGDRAQRVVAVQVAARIVQLLEVIEIDQRERERRPGAARVAARFFQRFVEASVA